MACTPDHFVAWNADHAVTTVARASSTVAASSTRRLTVDPAPVLRSASSRCVMVAPSVPRAAHPVVAAVRLIVADDLRLRPRKRDRVGTG
ncbi:hypothetical protein JCM11754A_38380 [Isoptericola variabilis]